MATIMSFTTHGTDTAGLVMLKSINPNIETAIDAHIKLFNQTGTVLEVRGCNSGPFDGLWYFEDRKIHEEKYNPDAGFTKRVRNYRFERCENEGVILVLAVEEKTFPIELRVTYWTVLRKEGVSYPAIGTTVSRSIPQKVGDWFPLLQRGRTTGAGEWSLKVRVIDKDAPPD